MANQTTPPIKSKNLWTGIATIVAAAFSFFAINFDPATVDTLTDAAHKAQEAITARNWVLLFSVVINLGNIIYHLFKGK